MASLAIVVGGGGCARSRGAPGGDAGAETADDAGFIARSDSGREHDAGRAREPCGTRVCGMVDGASCGTCGLHEMCTPAGDRCVPSVPPTSVDLLLLVDNSNGMAAAQTAFATQFPRLVYALATGDANGDGEAEMAPVTDLHVGVVSSDMGNGGRMVPTCSTTFGDDGVLNTRGNPGDARCMASYPAFLTFVPAGPGADPADFARDMGCVATLGTGGCGFEQHLDAMLKAVTPSSSPVRFTDGTTGHADRENAGFLRTDSLVAFVVLADEDDCSALDPDLFASGPGTRYTGNLNMRCVQYPEAVHPIARYTDLALGLRAIRPGRPDLVLFTAITGVPPDLVVDPARIDYEEILADARMQEREETVMTGGMIVGTGRLVPACSAPHSGPSLPGRRLTQVAQAFGEEGLVQSICEDDLGPAMQAITQKIASHLAR